MKRLSASPSSLPQDDAILVHFTVEGHDSHATALQGDNHLPDIENERLIFRPSARSTTPEFHNSFRVPQLAKIIPSVDSDLRISPSESTPLLAPLIPRIQESIECESSERSNASMVWEEARILSKYAFPVFGFVCSTSWHALLFKQTLQHTSV